MFIRILIAMTAAATLTACLSTDQAQMMERIEERQNSIAALNVAQAEVSELQSHYRTLAESQADEDDIEELRRLIAAIQAAIEALEARVDNLSRQIADLGGSDHAPATGHAAGDYAPVVEWEEDHLFFGPQRHAHVGSDASGGGRVAGAGRHENANLFYGNMSDGVSKSTLVSYLRADAATYTTGLNPDGFIRRFGDPPTVSVAEGATRGMIEETRNAVRIVNAALPPQWQLEFSETPQASVLRPEAGNILVEFALRSRWPGSHPSTTVGLARTWLNAVRNPKFDPATATRADIAKAEIATIATGRVWVDHTRVYGEQRKQTLVHELIHALGRAHADPVRFSDSVMVGGGTGKPGHVLHALDRDALLAVYGRLDPHTLPDEIATELGPWETTGLQVRGEIRNFDNVEFGVTLRNGVAEPWATGIAPNDELKHNSLLQPFFGPATWTGRLVGFTTQTEVVGGRAVMVVNMDDLDGELSFTSLEKWLPRSAPGAIGTGQQWGDGDLRYDIAVEGNTFIHTGGDDGTVTGAFFGDLHWLMGGTLERPDLTAAFGGRR